MPPDFAYLLPLELYSWAAKVLPLLLALFAGLVALAGRLIRNQDSVWFRLACALTAPDGKALFALLLMASLCSQLALMDWDSPPLQAVLLGLALLAWTGVLVCLRGLSLRLRG